uniref:Heat shock protein beta-1-like protein n=1 Tax=Callorhinchus milii TaxID=7868 RepID=V9L3M5_CALMI
MSEHPIYSSWLRWDPFGNCRFPSRLFDQDFGLPPFPEEPAAREWMEWVEKRLGPSWAGGFAPPYPAARALSGQCPPTFPYGRLSGGLSEVQQTSDRWRISLDVKHFAPEEIQVKANDGSVEISGKHEERPDRHGFISRSFIRKYKLPSEADLLAVNSFLTSDGILTIEAPLPKPTLKAPVEFVIPVQTEVKPAAEKDQEDKREVRQEKEVGQEQVREEEVATEKPEQEKTPGSV